MAFYKFNRKRGIEVVWSEFTTEQAVKLVEQIGDVLGDSLVRKIRKGEALSEYQTGWLHKLAVDRAHKIARLDASRVLAMLKAAADNDEENPALELRDGDGSRVIITPTDDGGADLQSPHTPDCKRVRRRGRISPDGIFTPGERNHVLQPFLEQLISKPLECAADFLMDTGRCLFCGAHTLIPHPACAAKFGVGLPDQP